MQTWCQRICYRDCLLTLNAKVKLKTFITFPFIVLIGVETKPFNPWPSVLPARSFSRLFGTFYMVSDETNLFNIQDLNRYLGIIYFLMVLVFGTAVSV